MQRTTRPKEIGIKELQLHMPTITAQAMRGKSFIIRKHGKPAFRIEPMRRKTDQKKYALDDIDGIAFVSGEKNLSRRVDAMVWTP